MNKNAFKIIIALAILGVSLFVYQALFNPQTQVGSKEITIEVLDRRDTQEKVIMAATKYHTEAEYLGDLIDEINQQNLTFTLSGNKSDSFGRMLTSIKGVDQNTTNNQYWMYESTNNVECVSAGFCSAIDKLPIYDQDHFVFYLQ